MVTFKSNIKGYKFKEFKVPYQHNAPWPTMRGDIQNSGRLKDLKWRGGSSTGNEVFHFSTGNAIFSTPVIDAEERIFVGSADHYFYALDPHKGKELWRFDAGEIIDCAGCIDKDNTVYAATGSSKIHAFSPDGVERCSYNNLVGRNNDIDPTTIITLRLLKYDKNSRIAVELNPKSIKIEADPYYKHRMELQSDGRTLNIIANKMLKLGTEYAITITVSYITDKGLTKSLKSNIKFKTRNPPQMASILSNEMQTYRIVDMAIPQPTIVPSLDQIGLASLYIPFSIIDADRENNTFYAFAVQKFGEVGVPLQRISLYAFTGRVQDDYFQMDCRNCEYEITAFAIPLDLFRIGGFLRTDGSVAKGGSMVIEKDWGGGMISLFRDLAVNSPISPKNLCRMLRIGGLKQFLKASKNFFPALLRQLVRGTWQTWGLLNKNNKLLGVGTFRLEPIENEKDLLIKSIVVERFELDLENRRVIAELKVPKRVDSFETVISIILVDKISKIMIPVNYNTVIKRLDLKNNKKRVEIPLTRELLAQLSTLKAFLMADIYPIRELEF
ncbi:MAG: hypothetical protein ACTSR8_03005 [Promethearchaeota archaeon]